MLLYAVAVAWVVFGFLSFGIVGFNYILARRAAKKTWKIRKDESYMPRVSIIVPTYNESEVIKYKLKNIMKLDYPKNLIQMVFVDSNSTDATVDIIRTFAQETKDIDTKVIVENERKGKTFALNVALKECTGEVVIVSDADCFWPSRILKDSLCYLGDPSIGAISGPKKLLNEQESWVTRNEGKYLKSMNLMKLGESKAGSTIFFEGGFAAFNKTTLNAFDPYDTGSDDCGTVIGVFEQDERAVMVPEAEFYTFFPRSWKGRTNIKIRRAVQLIRVLQNYLTLLLEGKIDTMKKTVVKNLLVYIFAPIMFLCFVATTVLLMLTIPLTILLLSLLLIPDVNIYLVEVMSSFLTMAVAGLLVASKKKSLIWKKPEDRGLVSEEKLARAGLV
jgi:cellulose synthase/poly-beta-1,6-N-acetylglucosamine synthase-like glycosyltransferase